jgi:hypothetical protein
MILLLIGAVVLVGTGAAFLRCLPRDGDIYRFANTEWEPCVGVAFTSGIALGCSMLLSGAFNVLG